MCYAYACDASLWTSILYQLVCIYTHTYIYIDGLLLCPLGPWSMTITRVRRLICWWSTPWKITSLPCDHDISCKSETAVYVDWWDYPRDAAPCMSNCWSPRFHGGMLVSCKFVGVYTANEFSLPLHQALHLNLLTDAVMLLQILTSWVIIYISMLSYISCKCENQIYYACGEASVGVFKERKNKWQRCHHLNIRTYTLSM